MSKRTICYFSRYDTGFSLSPGTQTGVTTCYYDSKKLSDLENCETELKQLMDCVGNNVSKDVRIRMWQHLYTNNKHTRSAVGKGQGLIVRVDNRERVRLLSRDPAKWYYGLFECKTVED